MGLPIEQDTFEAGDFERFSRRLPEDLKALRMVLDRPGFGEGDPTIGAELEMSLVDGAGFPLPLNLRVLTHTEDPRVTPEVVRFNMEANLRPCPLAGRLFTALREEFEDTLGVARRAAAAEGGRLAVVGLLPTLRQADLGSRALTDLPRYRAMSTGLRKERSQAPFHVAISGEDSLTLDWDHMTLQANTSVQFHLRVTPRAFARTYNAAQLATALVLAVSGNSPFFLGRRLWEETRVALFRQSVGDRGEPDEGGFQSHARVSFGQGWVREGAHELFAAAVALYPPLLPVLGSESSLDVAASGGVPALDALRIHMGTVWSWNRPVYDPHAGGHLRIELRALPAGPSVVDMVANGVFLLGLTLGLAEHMDALLPAMPFEHARGNFMRAARHGLDAELLWPTDAAPNPHSVPVVKLIEKLLPLAREGLVAAGVDAAEADVALGIIERRVALRRTGSRWQRQVLAKLEESMPRPDALGALLERYVRQADSGAPVHEWPLD